LVVLFVCVAGMILALPSFFGDDPALHISRPDGGAVQAATIERIETTLAEADIPALEVERDDNAVLVRFPRVEPPMSANELLREPLQDSVIALTLAPRMPGWLAALGLRPMSLGLDLRGGVHFLYQVDVNAAVEQLLSNYEQELRTQLREANIRFRPFTVA